jgi:hypothetical protein
MQDFLLDSDLDILFAKGDFATGESTIQNQQLLLINDKGDFKENPTACVGIELWLKDDVEVMGMQAEIKKEFERDGMNVKNIEITPEGQLSIDANY